MSDNEIGSAAKLIRTKLATCEREMNEKTYSSKGDFEQHDDAFKPTSRRSVEMWGGHIGRGSLFVTRHIEADYELSTQPCKFSHGIERSTSSRFVSNTSSCETSFRPTKPAIDYLTSRVYYRPW